MNMNTIAAGAYLWRIRESRKLSRIKVAKLIRDATGEGTNDVQVMRIEKGQVTSSAVFAAFIDIVGAEPRHVIELFNREDADAETGRALAREWIQQNIRSGTPSEQEERRVRAAQAIDALLHDSAKLDKLLGYADRLIEE